MEDLEYYKNYIIDNKNCIIIDIEKSQILYFNFNEMTFKEDAKKTLRPIRYNKKILYWTTQKWRPFQPLASIAIMKLFNNWCDRAMLREDDNREGNI